jgi:hypothetical protein
MMVSKAKRKYILLEDLVRIEKVLLHFGRDEAGVVLMVLIVGVTMLVVKAVTFVVVVVPVRTVVEAVMISMSILC